MASRFTQNLTRVLVRNGTSASRTMSTSSLRRAAGAEGASLSAAAPGTPPPAAAAVPPTSSSTSPKISAIVDQISTLTLLEAAELVDQLKTKLNIVDIAMPSAPAAGAASSSSAGGGAAAAEPEAEKPKEKTVFKVSLTKIDAAQKAKAIREVKALMPGMNLVEAKKFVESLPKVVKENATKEESDKLAALFKAIGAETTAE